VLVPQLNQGRRVSLGFVACAHATG
jgi:hypothetical protein